MNSYEKTMRQEADAILEAIPWLAKTYTDALPHLVRSNPVLLSGMGKSGIIAQKAASTLRSLGKPAHYVHPADASHGDLGAIHGEAVMICLSNSGETGELADLIYFCEGQNVPLIAVTSNPTSTLAKAATVTLCYGRVTEACPNKLAPTTSTTVQLAIMDALCVDMAAALGVTATDFKKFHPAGKLGKRLQTASEIMSPLAPVVGGYRPMVDVILQMTNRAAAGIVLVRHGDKMGIITDGDVRREGPEVFKKLACELMTEDPHSISADMRGEDILDYMQTHRVTKVLVEDGFGGYVGVINIHDLG